MPPLIRFMISHAAIGFGISFVFVGAILALDVSNLRALFFNDAMGLLALALLFFFSGLTFASVQMGLAVMALGEIDDTPSGGGLKARLKAWVVEFLAPPGRMELAPVPAKKPVPTQQDVRHR